MSVISVRIERKTKETLQKAEINMSKEMKQYRENLASHAGLKERLRNLTQLLRICHKLEKGLESVKMTVKVIDSSLLNGLCFVENLERGMERTCDGIWRITCRRCGLSSQKRTRN